MRTLAGCRSPWSHRARLPSPAIARRPAVFPFDEPLSNLDALLAPYELKPCVLGTARPPEREHQ